MELKRLDHKMYLKIENGVEIKVQPVDAMRIEIERLNRIISSISSPSLAKALEWRVNRLCICFDDVLKKKGGG